MGLELITRDVVVSENVHTMVLSIMILDMSGSMDVCGETPRKAVDEHVRVLREDKNAFYAVTVVGFNDTPSILQYLDSVHRSQPGRAAEDIPRRGKYASFQDRG